MSTIKDVSKMTGLSISTISKYINGGNVQAKNRTSIDHAIKALNFKVNHAARSLKTNRTMTVGILLPALDISFFANIVSDIEARLFAAGYNAFTCSYDHDPVQELRKFEFMLEQQVDGIILVAEYIDAQQILAIPAFAERRTPIVLMDRCMPGLVCDQVLVDSQSICRFATEQFILKKHTRIALIMGPTDIPTAVDRQNGYLNALNAHGLAKDASLIKIGDYSINAGYRLFRELMDLKEPPTALLCTNYEMTLGAVTAAFERKFRIPDDVSFIGYDDTQLTQIAKPPITIVLQPTEEIAALTSSLLLKRMRGDHEGFPHTAVLEACLLMHDSIASL